MDFPCNECAKSFAKEVDLVIHQLGAHDKCPFSRRGVSGKLHWERKAQKPHEKAQQEEGNSQKIHMCSSCPYETPYKHMFILPLRNTMQTVPLQTTNYKQGQTTNNNK